MSWAKQSDHSGTHPRITDTASLESAEEWTMNEVAGFVWRLGSQSAAHLTDYIVDVGTIQMIGMSRWQLLLQQCLEVGLLEPVTIDGRRKYKLLEDAELFHIRTRKEVEWERQQKRDTTDPHILVHVRRRDGDNCRWCGVLVQWRGKRSARTAWPDHLIPGEAGTVDTMVIACSKCQTSRQDNPQWVDDHPLRPVPDRPNFGKWTAKYLTENGYPTEPNIGPDAVIDPSSADNAPAAPHQAAQERPAAAGGTDDPAPTPRTSRTSPPARASKSTSELHRRSLGSRSLGSGQDGSGLGQVGTGQETGLVGAPPPGQPQQRRRRGRRGGKSRPRPQSKPQPQTPLSREDHTR